MNVKHELLRLMLPPAIIVHGLPMLRTALAPGRPVTLVSAEGAAIYAGIGWWRALIGLARAEYPAWQGPDILDCGNAPGRALEALRHGQTMLVLRADPASWADIAARTRACGAKLFATPPAALDLADPAAIRNLDRWLGKESGTTDERR